MGSNTQYKRSLKMYAESTQMLTDMKKITPLMVRGEKKRIKLKRDVIARRNPLFYVFFPLGYEPVSYETLTSDSGGDDGLSQ